MGLGRVQLVKVDMAHRKYRRILIGHVITSFKTSPPVFFIKRTFRSFSQFCFSIFRTTKVLIVNLESKTKIETFMS